MGAWLWTIALGLFLVLGGLYLHWSVVLAGALLPFLPVLAELQRRRRARRKASGDGTSRPPDP